ncbi:MAG TPA: hypothetical protein VFE33_27135 [Thermoanaerobaculia bacterium]|nr:hypothetical protein [Thermoanaerobaculia bacterium]
MVKTIHTTIDGEFLRPEEPVALAPNAWVLVALLRPDVQVGTEYSFLKMARSLQLGCPPEVGLNKQQMIGALDTLQADGTAVPG